MSDPDPTKPDLSLVDTEHMIDALQSRCDSLVIGYVPTANPDTRAKFRDHGSIMACLGMAVQLQHDILKFHPSLEPEDDDA